MVKSFFNDAIIGNSRMLGCLSSRGQLLRLFWPNIDYMQQIENFHTGVCFNNQKALTVWLHNNRWEQKQSYIEGTNILSTVLSNSTLGLEITQLDYCLMEEDVLIRQYEIHNISKSELDVDFIVYSSAITSVPEMASTLFDFEMDALIHYKHGHYMSIKGDREVYKFQLGGNILDSAKDGDLKGYNDSLMVNDGAMSFKIGRIKPGEKRNFSLRISLASSLKALKQLVKKLSSINTELMLKETKAYWGNYLGNCKKITTGKVEIDALYERSLLVFKLLSDEKSGAFMAAPEADENRVNSGRYAYCWGRDAAFIATALDECGLHKEVEAFYSWAAEIQEENGSWLQRYYMDGNLAPSWGMQIDETGSILWGIYQHYEMVKNEEFLRKNWNTVKNGVEFLLSFIDTVTGLPKPCFDLWEYRVGEHAYSAAAVYGGITAGVKIGEILKENKEDLLKWGKSAEDIKKSMERNLWKEENKCFLRGVKTKLNPGGSEVSSDTLMIKINSKGYWQEVSLQDETVDASLLGLSIPFDVFSPKDPRMEQTAVTIEKKLYSPRVGGILRFEKDDYVGENPWILTTLWLSLFFIKSGNLEKAKEYFNWAIKGRTELNLLPEQIDSETGKAAWIIPLTWSHAMFILVLTELLKAGEIY